MRAPPLPLLLLALCADRPAHAPPRPAALGGGWGGRGGLARLAVRMPGPCRLRQAGSGRLRAQGDPRPPRSPPSPERALSGGGLPSHWFPSFREFEQETQAPNGFSLSSESAAASKKQTLDEQSASPLHATPSAHS